MPHNECLRAYAKINLGLRITEKRPDGYHNLQTVFVQVPIYDKLFISESPDDQCHLAIEGIAIDGAIEQNLVIRAWQLAKDYAPERVHPVSICLHKLIPMGAGLGGGSSDAATVLRWCNTHFDLQCSDIQMEQMIRRIGADCPFFIQGGTTYATGIGDVFSPIAINLSGYTLVLVKPNVHVSTVQAYAGVSPHQPKLSVRDAIIQPIATWRDTLGNDFEPSVFASYPELATIKALLYKAGAVYASMSGSGSSLFGIFEQTPDEAMLRTNLPTDAYYWQGPFHLP